MFGSVRFGSVRFGSRNGDTKIGLKKKKDVMWWRVIHEGIRKSDHRMMAWDAEPKITKFL